MHWKSIATPKENLYKGKKIIVKKLIGKLVANKA